MKRILLSIIIFSIFITCKNDDYSVDTQSTLPTLERLKANAPFNIGSKALFYKDITYGENERNTFDFFSPNSEEFSPLLIFIHGGGFTGGDKSEIYSDTGFKNLVNQLLEHNIGVVSLNYRFIGEVDGQGVLNSLNDSKRALQFIRYYSNQLKIDKDNVVLSGSSAGAGTSLWIGLNDDMASKNSDNIISRESTRVKGIVALSTQSSYDVVEWHNSTFSEYQNEGMDFNSIVNLVGEKTVCKFYGISSLNDVYSPEILLNRTKLDMLSLMSSDDPEILISNAEIAYEFPVSSDALLHHPLHAKALIDKAEKVNLKYKAYIPQIGINNTNGEDITGFILRKLKN